MAYGEAEIIREIHAIRAANYERTKDLSPEERCRLLNEETMPIIEKYGFIVASAQPSQKQVRVG